MYEHKKSEAKSKEAPGEDFFVIDTIVDIKEDNNVKQFKVKWVGYPEHESTWEEGDSVPKFIQEYYLEDSSRIGSPLPQPYIKHSKKVGGTEYYYLKWDGQRGGQWLKEDFF